MGDWSELPQELLHLIAQRIDNCFDLIHFRSVCSTWRSHTPPRIRDVSLLQCPLPPDEGGFGDDCHMSKRRVYLLKWPSGDRHRYCLLKLREEENGELVPQNLFEMRCSNEYKMEYPRVSFDLLNCQVTELECEHMACYTEWFEPFECQFKAEEKVGFIRLGGGNEDFAVFGRLSFKRLAMFRSVDKCWTILDPAQRDYEETALFNGKFYTVDFSGKTTVVKKPYQEVSFFKMSRPLGKAKTMKRRLIRSGNELLLVELWMESLNYREWGKPERRKKIRVKICKLDEEKEEWDEVEDLGDRVLFLAYPSSFSCLASDIPVIKGNSVFFMEFWGESRDSHDCILVFELAEQSVRSVKDIPAYVELFQSPAGWVISNQWSD
ncbi:PREDICTED: putative F-box/kelch-repeat protein At5g24040 [Tarenaya hassleriana]|uniref:putative F-box/kelch-repeat protein At5g24040 n=1 Tax=Tarenaya hassleriana TaxID=28532 RepID=UPI00053C8681|nr:PREDICTED: putative F-box/kelch-repeat protein At5g24040 [Tarenaya hassleriana]